MRFKIDAHPATTASRALANHIARPRGATIAAICLVILMALGVGNPPDWKGSVFDRVWVLTYTSGVVSSFQNLPQKLLYGDSGS